MKFTVNKISGLKEEHYERLNLPLVHQTGIRALRFSGQKRAVHTVPLRNGLSLDFYADLGASEELVVTLHGAMPRTLKEYPWFARIRSVSPKAKALIAVADPTLQMDKKKEMLVSWYFGAPGWDPVPDILQAVRRAQGKTGAKHVAFIGGSGGALPALRASALLPGSLAFVQDPRAFFPDVNSHVKKYFSTAWPGWDAEKVINAFPSMFNMAIHYQDIQPQNFIYCIQNNRDTKYYQEQYLPFSKALGITGGEGISRNERYHFISYNGEFEGHGKITSREFDKFYEEAFSMWRTKRSS